MGVQDAAFWPSQPDSTPYIIKIVVEVKALRPSHVLKLCLGVRKCMLPVKYFGTNKSTLCVSKISLRSQGCHKDDVNLAILSFGHITRYKTVVSALLSMSPLTARSEHLFCIVCKTTFW